MTFSLYAICIVFASTAFIGEKKPGKMEWNVIEEKFSHRPLRGSVNLTQKYMKT